MRDSISARLIVIAFALIIALGFEFTIVWKDAFDMVGIVLAGFLLGPVLLLFISAEQWYSHRPKK